MSGVINEMEDAIMTFVRERVPSNRWLYLSNRRLIERELEDDDIDELRDYAYSLLMDAVSWSSITHDIELLVANQELDPETETESEIESEEEEEEETD